MPENSDLRKELIIEEYKACRELIGRNIEIIERNEVYVVGSCAAIFAFGIDKTDKWLSLGTAFLPITLALIGAARFWALSITINKIDNYLRSREDHHKVIGFTTEYQDKKPKSILKFARWCVWVSLITASVLFAYYRTSDTYQIAAQKAADAAEEARQDRLRSRR